MEEKNDKGTELINAFRDEAKALNNEELIKGWESRVYAVCYYAHSGKDSIAIEVFGEELISRKLKTFTELQEFYNFHKTQSNKELDNE
jgi:hypothetical protein